jgi:hypothetical protein
MERAVLDGLRLLDRIDGRFVGTYLILAVDTHVYGFGKGVVGCVVLYNLIGRVQLPLHNVRTSKELLCITRRVL